jgi:hypothetical protein
VNEILLGMYQVIFISRVVAHASTNEVRLLRTSESIVDRPSSSHLIPSCLVLITTHLSLCRTGKLMFKFSAARNILEPRIVTVKNPRFRASCRELFASNQLFWKLSCLPRHLSTSRREVHDEPLRILYCGSDAFSCTPLEALHQESQRPASNIASIDVVCREGKPYGRGLKSVRHRM